MLADLILIIHFFYVLFVVGSLPLIWFGAWFKWVFVRSVWFRYLHLAAIVLVVIESLLGVVCPLTSWENALRQVDMESSFIQQWLHRIIFYDVSENVLTVTYVVFAGLVVMTLKWVPIHSNRNQTLFPKNN